MRKCKIGTMTLLKSKLPSTQDSHSQRSLRVSCGLFGVSEDFIEKYQSLDVRFVKNKESTFFFEAAGDSMNPTILPGDILVVDRSVNHHHGRVCIVSYEGELLCKRVFLGRDYVLLCSDNKKFKEIRVFDQHEALVWGVVTARCAEVK